MSDLDEQIELARENVIGARHVVERQRLRIASGIAGPQAELLLESFERSLEAHERNLQQLLAGQISN
jgi:hypothetical protein